MSRKSILVAHPWLGRGGSEAAAMRILEALQDDFDISLATASGAQVELLNKYYGTGVDSAKVNVIKAWKLPTVQRGTRLVAAQHALFHRYCRSIAPRYDLCISAYNFVPFGKPGMQLVGDFSFSEDLRRVFYADDGEKLRHKSHWVRRSYLKAAEWIGGRRLPIENRGDLVLANSKWSARQLEEHCGLKNCDVLYPPVAPPNSVDSVEEGERDRTRFLFLGRVSPEKRVEEIILILDELRAKGHPVKLDLGGNRRETAYERKIASLAEDRPWVKDLGYISGREKEAALRRNGFGIQACRCEAFGIAAAEMAARGCLPLVAADCGLSEAVPFSELQFDSSECAVRKAASLLDDPERTEDLRRRVEDSAQQFSVERFAERVREYVDFMFQNRELNYVPADVVGRENLSAV